MDKTTLIVIILLIVGLLFLGFTLISGNANSGSYASNIPSSSYLGGGCGR